jgi:hypothetical protein
MFLGIIYVATYLNPTTRQEAEIRIRQVLDGYRVTAAISPLRDGDEAITWAEVTATEAAAHRVALRWRTILSLDHGMQQNASTPAGASSPRPTQEAWDGKPLRFGTDEP